MVLQNVGNMKVEYWDRTRKTKVTNSGFRYQDQNSYLIRVEDFPDGEEGFKQFYHKNNSLKYCNGSYYKFQNQEDAEKYKKFIKNYNTITNYYNGGIVD